MVLAAPGLVNQNAELCSELIIRGYERLSEYRVIEKHIQLNAGIHGGNHLSSRICRGVRPASLRSPFMTATLAAISGKNNINGVLGRAMKP